MTYASGQKISAADYNALLNLTPDLAIKSILNTFGTGFGNVGFGGNSTNVSVPDLTVASTKITSAHWKNLRNAFGDCASHLGLTLTDVLPNSSLLNVGGKVTFYNTLNSSTNVGNIYNNRLSPSLANMTTTTNKLVSSRITAWSTAINHTFTVTFSSANAARYFFNTGGLLLINASRTGGSITNQNAAWTNLFSANGPFNFSHNQYYALTNAFTTIATYTSPSPYGSNTWIIQARYDDVTPDPTSTGAKGGTIRINSLFTDGYTSIFTDTVDGTISSTIGERRSTGVFNIASPTYTTIIGL